MTLKGVKFLQSVGANFVFARLNMDYSPHRNSRSETRWGNP